MGHDGHDDWFHSEHDADQMAAHGDFNATAIIGFLFGVIVLTAAVVVVVLQYYRVETQSLKYELQERNTQNVAEYNESVSRWNADLYGAPEWIDPAANRVRIPLDIADDQVIGHYGRNLRELR